MMLMHLKDNLIYISLVVNHHGAFGMSVIAFRKWQHAVWGTNLRLSHSTADSALAEAVGKIEDPFVTWDDSDRMLVMQSASA